MGLSRELISQFVKITNDNTKPEKETTLYGTSVEYGGSMYVRFDGSDLLTPISTMESVNSTVDIKAGERVLVMIKNHHVIVTGNVTSKSVGTKAIESVKEGASLMGDEVNALNETVVTITGKVTAAEANILDLETVNATINEKLTAAEANILDLETVNATVNEKLTAAEADIGDLKTDKLDAETAKITYATIEKLDAATAKIGDLQTDKLSVTDADIKYANIDFTNIGSAAMEYLYSKSGLIENVIIGDGTITGTLVGVTIKGDTIEANTVVADKLVIQGEDGLYYKLNTDGVTTEAEQTEYNSLNGSIITAKSITATQISVSDLVAFDATIGGFNITENSIFSEVKDSEGNTTRGIYMDTDGQINFGDANNFIKYYKQEDGTYKLAISAESIMYAFNGTQHDISDLGMIGEYVKIGTYEGEPCIELGEKDSDFKLLITNTRILFMEGTTVPAYINNQSLYISKAVVEEELQQGEFVWKVRSNGNLGLVWKGVNS